MSDHHRPQRSTPRILTVTHFFEAHGGGIERVAAELNRQLSRLGFDVAWAAADGDPLPNMCNGVPLRCVNLIERLTGLPMPLLRPAGIAALLNAARDRDIVLIHDALYLTSIIAALAAWRNGKRVVLIQHIAAIPFSNPLLKRLMRLANLMVAQPMIRGADQTVFISETTKSAFCHVRTKRPALLVFNGVDPEIFNPHHQQARLSMRNALGLQEGKRLILFVGRFVAKKGLPILAALATSRPDLAVLLVGRGSINPETWQLPNVFVLRGKPHESLGAVYCAADLFLLPSVGEGYPLVIQEAMACGLPIICGRETARADPGASQWLKGIEVDLNRPAHTAEIAAQAIDTLAMDAVARAEMANYARQTYSWARMAKHIADAITNLRETR